MCLCATRHLGAELYSSSNKTKLIYHTCKSKYCPRCGKRATTEWLRREWRDLPEIEYVHVTLTMPDHFWGLFRLHRNLEHDLPQLGALVLAQWAREHFNVELYIVSILHTYGKWVTYNPHVHLMVSKGGFDVQGGKWLDNLSFPETEPFLPIQAIWRDTLVRYILAAQERGILNGPYFNSAQFHSLVKRQGKREDWQIRVGNSGDRYKILKYAGRYARHPPISSCRIISYTPDQVVFKVHGVPQKPVSMKRFIENLVLHVQQRYRHSVRYFGLLSPLNKQYRKEAVFNLIKQPLLAPPTRQSFQAMSMREFKVDPLLDSEGHSMKWVKTLTPEETEWHEANR